ncbi:hypothetical protein EVAR_37762_1 [Eumeta japonica]|uniref:Uncharacterized protein n=1 Tax=Eumeta variegata TaxID=151549 RepID=A0A4C1WQI8_EUMVA|nr:hypothetical protein EVAR_37762_1 [Eumeta japonica]
MINVANPDRAAGLLPTPARGGGRGRAARGASPIAENFTLDAPAFDKANNFKANCERPAPAHNGNRRRGENRPFRNTTDGGRRAADCRPVKK